jgi:hypothetical protein
VVRREPIACPEARMAERIGRMITSRALAIAKSVDGYDDLEPIEQDRLYQRSILLTAAALKEALSVSEPTIGDIPERRSGCGAPGVV